MKTTFFFTIISLILFIGCSTLNSSEKIKTFEQTLGMDNSKALTEYVNAFESEILKKQYPTLTTEKAYAKLLSEDPRDIVNMRLYNQLNSYNIEDYFKSQFWHEIYAPVDSVWIENNHLYARFVYMSSEGKKKIGKHGGITVKGMDQDSIITQESSICYFNNQGKYWQAIESIQNGVPFLEDFYSAKTELSEIGIGHFAAIVSRHNLDLNNYLARRIIAVELGKFINDAREPKENTFTNKT